jgi:hypothetical protein
MRSVKLAAITAGSVALIRRQGRRVIARHAA